jgi:hypothetical protein
LASADRIGDNPHGNKAYRRHLWIEKMEGDKAQVTYVPTENRPASVDVPGIKAAPAELALLSGLRRRAAAAAPHQAACEPRRPMKRR